MLRNFLFRKRYSFVFLIFLVGSVKFLQNQNYLAWVALIAAGSIVDIIGGIE